MWQSRGATGGDKMAVWVLKGGRVGEREQRILERSVVGMGWDSMPDLSQFKDRTALEATYRHAYPGAMDGRVANHVGQLYAFVHTARPGDLVVVPLKTRAAIAIGEITGDYAYRTDLGPDMTHTRPVRWLRGHPTQSVRPRPSLHFRVCYDIQPGRAEQGGGAGPPYCERASSRRPFEIANRSATGNREC
jgi:hypothetical protein